MSAWSVPRLSAMHVWLLAVTIGLSTQENTWAATYGVAACSIANLLVWLLYTRRATSSPSPTAVVKRSPLLLLLPALYFGGLTLRFGAQDHTSLTAAISVASCALTFLVVALVHSRQQDGRSIMFALATVGALLCLQGIVHEWSHTHGFADLITYSPFRRDLAGDQWTRLNYPIAYPNALATVLLFFAACSAGAVSASRRMPERIAWLAVFLLHCGCILLTGSHGGVISLLFIPLAWIGREVRAGRAIAFTGITVMAAAVAWMLRKPYARLRGSGSLLQRAHGWIVTLKITTRSPWFGEGPGAFAREWAGYGPAHGYSNQFGLDGFYANLLCEGGVVSLTVLSTLVIAAAREVKRLLYTGLPGQTRTSLYYMAVGLGTVLIHSIVESTLSTTPIIVAAAALFGLITAARYREGTAAPTSKVTVAPTDKATVAWSGSSYSSGPRSANR